MDMGSLMVGALLTVVVLWAVLLMALWVLRPKDVGLRELVGIVPDVLRLIRDLLADRSTPRGVRIALLCLLAWLISPIDLVPEFIPVLGPLDDVIVAVLVLRYVRRCLGTAELRRRWRGSDAGFELLGRVLGSG